MKSKLLALAFLAGGSVFAAPAIHFGIEVGYPAPPPAVAYVPPCPGPGYTWVAGYWYNVGPRQVWHAGYWAAPRHFDRGFRAAPHFRGRR